MSASRFPVNPRKKALLHKGLLLFLTPSVLSATVPNVTRPRMVAIPVIADTTGAFLGDRSTAGMCQKRKLSDKVKIDAALVNLEAGKFSFRMIDAIRSYGQRREDLRLPNNADESNLSQQVNLAATNGFEHLWPT